MTIADTTPDTRTPAEILADVMSQPWVGDLFAELTERQQNSMALAEEVREHVVTNHVFLPFHAPMFPLAVAEAQGSRLTDVDGNTYIDSHLGFGGQSLFGHNPPQVVEFVREQALRSTGNGYLNPLELKLGELLKELIPHCEKFALLNSGTDAIAIATRLARAYTGKRLVAKFEGCWHGTGDVAAHNTSFFAHGHPKVNPFPEIGPDGIAPLTAFTGVPQLEMLILPHDAAAASKLIEKYADDLACVVADAACQSWPFTDQTIPELREVAHRCQDLGVPFILDEVLTGFRFGTAGAAGHFDIPADLHCYGKVVSGLGLPLAAIGGKAELLEAAHTSGMPLTDIGSKTFVVNTHSGNHLSIAASYASLSMLRDAGPAFYERTEAKVARVQSRLADFRAETGIPLRLLGFGAFAGTFGFTARDSYDTYREFGAAANPLGPAVLTLMLRKRGVYTLSMPMFYTGDAHSDADVDAVCDAVIDAAREMGRNDFPFVIP
ncbi:aminotransferase class III-fold pyridoxal phosphate-dependent enzyme [Micromonospora sp. NBRC 101691]|uniref:aminotransferase class III-fold pyridoxal phosphate-dependent enzyme n=1 Tax=Micromonospora sp. NBRC 101691 TaxID=3032198 RepID=UPI0024A17E7C|nr:aminotransferase class III-fold pyridoxal phosphate-dependent enzyme [Micromonospora sp. NBRC 101691]GLY20924.1 glutamate-1-semialdehyde 2,1-aminomutase [Micromonospora sp. NBRC 101691]